MSYQEGIVTHDDAFEVTTIFHIIALTDYRQSAMVALEKVLKSTKDPLSVLNIRDLSQNHHIFAI